MTRVLLIDENADHAQQLGLVLAQRGLTVVRAADIEESIRNLRKPGLIYDLVILIMADRSRPWLKVLHKFQQACLQAAFLETPLFLCVAKLQFGPEFQLQIEQRGARYVFEG